MLTYEQQAWNSGTRLLVGVDEAGRGCLAGPVVAAAVMIERAALEAEQFGLFNNLNDSKQLTANVRDTFFQLLTKHPKIYIGVGMVSAPEIDEINILSATDKAMSKAISNVKPFPELALVDGRRVPGLPCPSQAIVKGDTQSLSIAAASVVAKVTRDRLMEDLDKQYPQYGFKQHKGYGTRQHIEALQKYGVCEEHRKSFRPVKETLYPPAYQQSLL